MRRFTPIVVHLVALALLGCSVVCGQEEAEWVALTDGKSMEGWKVNENPKSWTMVDGAFVGIGERSHLFYVGDDKPFKNFEFKAKVKCQPNANGGIYFHTQYQDSGWPKHGYEAQVNNTHGDRKKSGGLYDVQDVLDNSPAKDGEWFDYYIKVEGKTITIKINDKETVKYTEPEGKKPGQQFTRVLTEGTFGLQCHDPGAAVSYKEIQVRRLPD
ncbi:MAG: DUF1080 domain-containing protein [Planctomycetaceae bacterium]|nr:DUF1080 domain-containing protein [Planctomycetaceae bacterium]